MKRNLGMSARKKAQLEIAALAIKVALDDLPNNPGLCNEIVRSAEVLREAVRLKRAQAEVPWYRRLWRAVKR